MKAIYTLSGEVIRGMSRGKSLGFPTANIELTKKIPEGIYASKVTVDDNEYLAAVFVGCAKTFNEAKYRLEVYIIDFCRDIYGKEIKIKLYNKLRENKKFKSADVLIAQIKKDVEAVKIYFNK